jgi:hypothetical protein
VLGLDLGLEKSHFDIWRAGSILRLVSHVNKRIDPNSLLIWILLTFIGIAVIIIVIVVVLVVIIIIFLLLFQIPRRFVNLVPSSFGHSVKIMSYQINFILNLLFTILTKLYIRKEPVFLTLFQFTQFGFELILGHFENLAGISAMLFKQWIIQPKNDLNKTNKY